MKLLVFRALVLGDMLCATPALRALRAGMPGAHITLLGLPWARALVERLPSVDAFLEFPGWPGWPEREAPASVLQEFLRDMRARRFDLALQLHGSGEQSNHILAAFGARALGGLARPGAWVPAQDAARFAPWSETGSEVERLLALTDRLGLPRQGLALDFPLRAVDHAAAAALREARIGAGRYAVVHPGSQLPSRRWPPERFAAVADALADAGMAIVLSGSAAEQVLTARVAAAMRAPALDLAGRSDLWTLGALIDGAAVLVCNDTGVSHIAAARGTPSVVIASGSDMRRWAPADRRLHRVVGQDMPCRPCAAPVCPYAEAAKAPDREPPHSLCALAVGVKTVRDVTLQLIEEYAHHGNANGAPAAHPDLARARELSLQPHAGAA